MTRRNSALLLLGCLAVSLVCVAYPVYVIRPFRAQGPRELLFALFVLRLRPVLTVLSAIAAVAALVFYWRARMSWWRRSLAVVGALLVCGMVPLARVNIYELMFHPDERPTFASAGQTKLDNDEKVISIRVGNAARAYPIRNISYHHVINDVLDNHGVVATY